MKSSKVMTFWFQWAWRFPCDAAMSSDPLFEGFALVCRGHPNQNFSFPGIRLPPVRIKHVVQQDNVVFLPVEVELHLVVSRTNSVEVFQRYGRAVAEVDVSREVFFAVNGLQISRDV